MARRVAVIGGGSAGLVCIKSCLDEGLEPVCFESSDDIGGVWRFKESPEPERASIYRSLVSNTSKEMMCYSDFPMPAHYPNFMHNSQLLQYLRLYADHFDLLRHIRFQTCVKSVAQTPDFSESGRWDVVTVNGDGEEERHVFDAVFVCSGQYTKPSLPLSDFPGHERFPGRILHSWEYKDADACRGQRVVVVGIGNSGGDIAVEISRCAQKTFLSTRQGAWVVGKMSTNGLPLDMTHITRLINTVMWLLPRTLLCWSVERDVNRRYDHTLYGLKPKYRILDQRPLINDDLPSRILTGSVVMKPNVSRFEASTLVFEDGSVEENIDVVVFCTGYQGKFPFLPPALTRGPHNTLSLYKKVFPPSLSRPTLAVMGLFQTKGPIMPFVEMQARWAVRVFTGRSRLPSEEKMQSVIESETENFMKSYGCEGKAALQVDYVPYLDFMAEQIGVRPNLLSLLLRDPALWVQVFFGPLTPYQYRLTGPGRWPGARQAILTQWDRTAQPFRTRVAPEPEAGGRTSFLSSPTLLAAVVTVTTAVVLSSTQRGAAALQGAARGLDVCQTFLKNSLLQIKPACV